MNTFAASRSTFPGPTFAALPIVNSQSELLAEAAFRKSAAPAHFNTGLGMVLMHPNGVVRALYHRSIKPAYSRVDLAAGLLHIAAFHPALAPGVLLEILCSDEPNALLNRIHAGHTHFNYREDQGLDGALDIDASTALLTLSALLDAASRAHSPNCVCDMRDLEFEGA